MAVKATAPAPQPPDLASLGLALAGRAPLPMATVEGASHIVRYVNPAFCRLLDQPIEQLVGKPFCETLPDKDECVKLLDHVFRTGKPESHTEQEYSEPHPVFWSYTMWPVLAEERPVGVMIQVTETAQFHEKTLAMNEALMLGSVRQHELTEASDNLNAQLHTEMDVRKRAEEALGESEERFRFMAESMPQKIFTAKPNGDVDYFNRQWTEFTGLSFEQIKDWGWTQFIHPGDVKENVRRWQHSIDTGEPFELEHRFRRADGAYHWHLSRVFPMRDADGNITMWIGSNTDIDDQKRTEEALRQSEAQSRVHSESAEAARISAEAARTRAETATRAKDDFLAALSHELRTPLNPALLLATALADDATLSARVRGDIDVISKGIALQAQLVDDMLDLTRITTGKLRLDLQPIDAHLAMRHAYEIVRADAHEQQIEVTFDLAAAHNCIKADAVRVQQIFWNVLKNAVKFTPPGGAITVRTHNPAENERMLVVEISDTGVGIAPEMLGQVFDALIQEEHAGTHRFGGIGLGLAITRRLVEAQDGRIHAESAGRGQGATFHIELPLEAPELCAPGESQLPGAPRDAPSAQARRILLVEDHELTRTTLARLLQRRGHHVVTAATAAQARELVATSECDLIISDLGLPDGDGHALLVELRNAHNLPAIALSGYGMEEDRERSRQSGFFMHLTKPIDIHVLENAIAAAPPALVPLQP